MYSEIDLNFSKTFHMKSGAEQNIVAKFPSREREKKMYEIFAKQET